MNASLIVRLSLRLLVLLVLITGLAACQETPTDPDYPDDDYPAAVLARNDDDGGPPSVNMYEDYDTGMTGLYEDAISFTPGSITLWPQNTTTVEVSIAGTMPRLGPLDVALSVPWGLSVDGAGNGVDHVVSIPTTSNRTTFRVQALMGAGQVREIRGTAPRYRPGALSVRTEHVELAEAFREHGLEFEFEEPEPMWWLEADPASHSMQVCDVETVTITRHDITWQIWDLEVLLNVPAGLGVGGPTVSHASGSPVLTIPAGSQQADFEVHAVAGSPMPYIITASAGAHRPVDITVDVAVPSVSLAPASETILVGQTKPVTLAHNAGTCAPVPVTMSTASGLSIAGGASGSTQTVTIPAGAASTSVALQAVHAGGSPYTVAASNAVFNPASMTVTVPTPTLDLQVSGSNERLVHWGQSATYTLEVSGTNWHNQTVELETRGTVPDGVSASFSPPQVTLSAAQPSQQVTLTLATSEGETELYSENNDRPHDIRIRATPTGFHSLALTSEVELSVLRTNGGFAAFGMGTSTQTHPSGVVGEVSNGFLNFRYDGRTDGPYHPFLGFGISSAGRVGVVHHAGLSSGSGSQTKFVNLRFPQRAFGTSIWSSQNSINGYAAGWYYSPDNSLVLVAARDCSWASQNNTVCSASNVPLVVTLIDALDGVIGGNRGIGQATLGGSAVQITSNGTVQTVVLTKSNGQTVMWELSR